MSGWLPSAGQCVRIRGPWPASEHAPPTLAVVVSVGNGMVEFSERDLRPPKLPYFVGAQWFRDNYEPDDFMDAMERIEA